MNNHEFKEKLNKEVEAVELTDSPYKTAEKAFYERQAKAGQQNKKNSKLRILSNFAVSLILIVGLVLGGIYLFRGEEEQPAVLFDQNTPYIQMSSLEEISDYTDKDIKLPKDFDSGFALADLKMFFPKENEPCAIEIDYTKIDGAEVSIKIIIMINSNYNYYRQSVYEVCNEYFEIDGIVIYHYTFVNMNDNITFLKFTINGNEYFLHGINISIDTVTAFIKSLV